MRTSIKALLAIAIIGASFFLNAIVSSIADSLQNPTARLIADVITDSALAIAIVIPTMLLWRKKNKLPALYAAITFAFLCSYFLKFMLKIPRPGNLEKFIAFTQIKDYGLPSTHSSIVFSPLYMLGGRVQALWAAYAALVALSRIYLGMHNLSDVVAGAALGYFLGMFFDMNSRLDIQKDLFELRRQASHLVIGLVIATAVYWQIAKWPVLLGITIAGGALSFLVKKKRILLISWLLERFERKEEIQRFPGKGALFLFAGSTIAAALLPKEVAAAAIAILATGDSISHVIGRFFGRTRQPFSVKLVEGTAAGIIAGFLSAVFFVAPQEALAASVLAMSAEAIDIQAGFKVDDNLLIPIVAGATIMVMRLLI